MGNFHSWMKHFGFFCLSLLDFPFLQKLVCFPNRWKNAQKLIIFWDYQTDFRFSSCKALNQIPTSSNNYIRILWSWWFSTRSALKAVLILSLFPRKRGRTVKKNYFFPPEVKNNQIWKQAFIQYSSSRTTAELNCSGQFLDSSQRQTVDLQISLYLRQKDVTSRFFTAPGGNNLNTLSMHLEGEKILLTLQPVFAHRRKM